MKLPDWQNRLTEFLMQTRDRGDVLDWDGMSCAKFACGAIEAQTGKDYHSAFEGLYTDPHSAMVALKQFGYKSVLEYVRTLFPEVPKIMAQHGDIVVIEAQGTPETDLILEADFTVGGDNRIPEGVFIALGVAEPPLFWALSYSGLVRGRLIHPAVITSFRIGE